MKHLKIILTALLTAALIIFSRHFNASGLLKESLESIKNLGPWAPLIFIALYVATTVLLIPGSILTLGSGVLFGVFWGTFYVSIASTIGAMAAFALGRGFARDWISRKIKSNSSFNAVSQAAAREGWKIVVLTRLSPIFPFNLLNYAFGLTDVSFRDYVFASWIGMLPGTILYVYIGSLAGDLARVGISSGHSRPPVEWAFYSVGLLATIAVSIYIGRIAKAAIAQKTSKKAL